MTQPDPVSAIGPIVGALEQLSVSYYIGGSVASSVHGLPRMTLDVDLVANLKPDHVEDLSGSWGMTTTWTPRQSVKPSSNRRRSM